jgi:hypothetical protein
MTRLNVSCPGPVSTRKSSLSLYRRVIDFRVETPDGDLIDPGTVGALVDSTFVPGVSLDAYRLSLPAIWPTHSAQAGRWYARLEIGGAQTNVMVASHLRESEFDRGEVYAHGVPFSVSVQAQSSLTMTVDSAARKASPITVIDHRVSLKQLDLPLDTPCTVTLDATDPAGGIKTMPMQATGPGEFAAATDALVAGVYAFRYVGRGTSFAGVAFMREQVRTVGVWEGGDDQPPRSDPAGEGRCSEIVNCILENKAVSRTPEGGAPLA